MAILSFSRFCFDNGRSFKIYLYEKYFQFFFCCCVLARACVYLITQECRFIRLLQPNIVFVIFNTLNLSKLLLTLGDYFRLAFFGPFNFPNRNRGHDCSGSLGQEHLPPTAAFIFLVWTSTVKTAIKYFKSAVRIVRVNNEHFTELAPH